MKKKVVFSVFVIALILICSYIIVDATRYNNIDKIQTSILYEVTINEKEDIRVFMKSLDSKSKLKEPMSLIIKDNREIPNNVKIYYKNGNSISFLMLMDDINNNITCMSESSSTIGYKIDSENTEKIIDLLKGASD